MVELIGELRVEVVRANLERIEAEIAACGRAGEVEILAAVKYVPVEQLGELARAGVKLVGENRAQELVTKSAAWPGRFTWDFIGTLQSRKVAVIVPHVRYIHSVATESALAQLARHATASTRILAQVNVSGEAGKAGIAPDRLGEFLEASPVPVAGLMTMPPLATDPEHSRRYFVQLRALAQLHGLVELSMGTSQDYVVAVQEGATIIRLGQSLYRPFAS